MQANHHAMSTYKNKNHRIGHRVISPRAWYRPASCTMLGVPSLAGGSYVPQSYAKTGISKVHEVRV